MPMNPYNEKWRQLFIFISFIAYIAAKAKEGVHPCLDSDPTDGA